MSMTIIKQGVDPKHTYLAKCPNCGTIFTYEWDDTKSNEISSWHEHHVICPVCTYESGWNDNPLKQVPLTLTYSGIIKSPVAALIPNGCTAYALYLKGTEILTRQIFDVIPAGHPVLIVGSCSNMTLVPGLQAGEILNLPPLPVTEVTADDDLNSYYTINEDLSVITATLTDFTGWVINPTGISPDVLTTTLE